MTFVNMMIDIHNNPNDKKDWDKEFYDEVSPFLEELERSIQTASKICDEIWFDTDTLEANPTQNGAIDLLEKSKNHARRCTTVRNTDLTKIRFKFHNPARTSEAKQIAAKEQRKGWILKCRLQTFEYDQSSTLDEIITSTEIIHKTAQDLYNKLTKPQKGFQFRPMELNKHPRLTLSTLKSEWETLSGWKKMQE